MKAVPNKIEFRVLEGDVVSFAEGKKIYLRALSEEDIPVWYNWFNSYEITAHMNKGGFPNTQIEQRSHLEKVTKSKNDFQLAIVEKKTNTLAGIIGLHKIDWVHRRGDISIVIGERKFFGKKYGQQAIALLVKHAFQKLNFHKLTAGMWATNLSSKKAFENNFFKQEGCLKEQFWSETSYVDELRYGLLRTTWETENKD